VEGDRLPPGHTVSQLETCKIRSIRAGTLERLVETLLTAFGDNDLTYTSIFLSTYRAFASTQSVLQLLLDRCVEGDRLPPGHTVSQLETCKIRSIRAGTLERLVETLLTAFGDNDLTYTSIFLSTYRAFASTQSVLQLLLD
ncbi:ral guanine nucleotide dissociation stimulator-like 1 isoform X1, partial [Tachysurus ichikawai]